ncbi:MAG: hypothetical protein AAGA75_09950 [Cyanobacteria bacterium P01_E01_bin.6]
MSDSKSRIDIAALFIAVVTAIVTAILTIRTDRISKELNQHNLFAGTVADAVDHLADQDPVRRRLAIISLANSATNQEQVIQVVKAIIITSRNDLESSQDVDLIFGDRGSELGILFQIASLDDERAELYGKALEDREIKELIAMFLPLSGTPSEDQIRNVPDSLPEEDTTNLSNPSEDIDLLENQALAIELTSLVSNMYSSDRTSRRSATAILSQESWRPYDILIVREIIKAHTANPDSYFGLVNSLFILDKVSDSSIRDGLEDIKMLIQNATRLSESDQSTYLDPIISKVSNFERN